MNTMKKLIATALIIAACLSAGQAEVIRYLTLSPDITGAPNMSSLGWMQAEGIQLDLYVKAGTSYFPEFTNASVQLIWEVTTASEYPTNVYAIVTGAVVAASNAHVRFSISAPDANLTAGSYYGFVRAYIYDAQTNLTHNLVLTRSRIQVYPTPQGAELAYVTGFDSPVIYSRAQVDSLLLPLYAFTNTEFVLNGTTNLIVDGQVDFGTIETGGVGFSTNVVVRTDEGDVLTYKPLSVATVSGDAVHGLDGIYVSTNGLFGESSVYVSAASNVYIYCSSSDWRIYDPDAVATRYRSGTGGSISTQRWYDSVSAPYTNLAVSESVGRTNIISLSGMSNVVRSITVNGTNYLAVAGVVTLPITGGGTNLYQYITNIVNNTSNYYTFTTNLYSYTTNVYNITTNNYTTNLYQNITNITDNSTNLYSYTTNVYNITTNNYTTNLYQNITNNYSYTTNITDNSTNVFLTTVQTGLFFNVTIGSSNLTTETLYVLSGSTWILPTATNPATCSGLLGYPIGTNSANGMIINGVVTLPSLLVGSNYYVSATAGAITETAPTNVGYSIRMVGVAIATNTLHMIPSISIRL